MSVPKGKPQPKGGKNGARAEREDEALDELEDLEDGEDEAADEDEELDEETSDEGDDEEAEARGHDDDDDVAEVADVADEVEAERFTRDLGDEGGAEGEKPALLKAIEKILADPEQIKLDVEKLRVKYRRDFRGPQLSRVVAEKLVDRYGRRTMLVGGASALAGVVPGLGTVVGAFGTAIADAALSMKYEIEMVQAIAFAYGRDITVDEERTACLVIAGVGTLAEVGKFTGKRLGTEAFVKAVRKILSGNVARFVFLIFRLLGLKLGPKAILNAIPFGIGLGLNVLANRTVTRIVGARAIAYFEAA